MALSEVRQSPRQQRAGVFLKTFEMSEPPESLCAMRHALCRS
jgi:hypothetical protein